MNRTMSGVFVGMMLANSIQGLRCDIMGLERFKAYVDATWVSGWYTVPIEVIGIAVACFWIFMSWRAEEGR